MGLVGSRYLSTGILIAFSLLCLGQSVLFGAALSYSGGTYTQDFNGLPNDASNAVQVFGSVLEPNKGPIDFTGNVTGATNLDGWQLANPNGNNMTTEFRSQDGSLGSSSGRGVISFGANGSSQRALGALSTSAQVSSFGLVLTNNTSTTFTGFNLSFSGQHWRRGDVTTPDQLAFSFGVANDIAGTLIPSSRFVFSGNQTSGYSSIGGTQVAVDGSDASHKLPVNNLVSGIKWAPGQNLVLRWNAQDITGQDDGLAIDNLSFAATTTGVIASRGDFDFDGKLTNGDIQGMLNAIVDLASFQAAAGLSDSEFKAMADFNASDAVTADDLPPFLQYLAGNGGSASIAAVPEPGSIALFAFGVVLLCSQARCQRDRS